MRYVIRQKYFSLKDGYYIKEESGRDAFFVQGKIFTIGKKLWLNDSQGNEIYFIKERLFRLLGRFDILQSDNLVAKMKRTLPLLLVKRYKVSSDKYGDFIVKGSAFAWNFTIKDANGNEIGQISKKILKIADTYTVEVYNDRLAPLILSIALILDARHHKKH